MFAPLSHWVAYLVSKRNPVQSDVKAIQLVRCDLSLTAFLIPLQLVAISYQAIRSWAADSAYLQLPPKYR